MMTIKIIIEDSEGEVIVQGLAFNFESAAEELGRLERYVKNKPNENN